MTHFIQRAGIPTTSVSLIREHSEAIGPTRALWVPFPLGRPFGVPNDPDFQREVLRNALRLLETATEPTIEDYPIEAPESSVSEVWACPIALPRPEGSDLEKELRAEVDQLAPWYAEARRARGRSAFTNSGATEDQLDSVVSFLLAIAQGDDLQRIPNGLETVAWAHKMPILIRHVCEDLRAFYQAAALARPGPEMPNHNALNKWIFRETALGKAVLAIGEALSNAGDPRYMVLRFYIIPEGFWPGQHTFGATAPGQDRIEFAIRANAFLAGDTD